MKPFLKLSQRVTRQSGFTLIELIAVLVILGVVSAIGSNFIVSTVRSYDVVQGRAKLINRGRVTLEQMTRQIRLAMPNSARVSNSGSCVEFMPLIAGTNYLDPVPDSANSAAQTNTIATAPFQVSSGTPAHVSVGALDSNEIYTSAAPSGRVTIGSLGAGPTYTSVPLANTHRFNRNSVSQRIFIAADPIRFCLVGTSLLEYSGYGLSTAALIDIPPSGVSSSVMAENVSTSTRAFSLSAGTEDVSTAVDISLQFSQGTNQVNLSQQVLIRNVP